MNDVENIRSWERLDAIAISGDAERLQDYVESLPPSELARALAHLGHDEQSRVLETLGPEGAADLIEDLPVSQAAALVEHLSVEVAAAIVHELPSDEQADLLVEMADDQAQAVLGALDPTEAGEIRELSRYPEDVAGGLMVTELIAVRIDASRASVVESFRRAVDLEETAVQYIYVVDADERLVGVLRLRDLLLVDGDLPIASIMIAGPVTVPDDATLQTLEDTFDRYGFLGIPVVDADHRLLGIVQQADVRDATGERAEERHLKAAGIVGGEELRTMPLLLRSRRRLSWLSINIVLNVIAASVIALFEDTLTAVIALAFFLPIISDMSGCSGNQAVAVSVRELALGQVKPYEVYFVWLKEIGVGAINGTVLGLLIGVVAWLWRGNVYLGVVVGLALTVNTMIAVSIGGAVPLILKRFKMDPALASGPVLTTITDICGFFLVLGIATAMLPLLVG
jgi:magnesium transporter